MSAFVQKAVEYLLRSEEPVKDGKGNSSPLLIQVHPDFDRRMKTLAQANYPSISCLIRTAIVRQLVIEELQENQGKWTPPTSQDEFFIKLLYGKFAII